MAYDIGDQVRLTCTFTNLSGTVADPTSVVLRMRNPSGTVTTPDVTQSSTGVYYADVTLDAAGDWRYRFEGTGAIVSATEGILSVQRSRF